jgi:two-component system, NtrC family, response regulator HydG
MNDSIPSILVVDDEVDTCQNMADIFTDLGYQVDTAQDGASGLELVRRQRYDVALVDLMMPGMDGATLCAEMRKVRAETVALLVTAFPNSPRADQAVVAGAWRVVPKPVELPKVMALIEEAAGQPLVLVVDDDVELCASLWDLLREEGFRVCLAHDAATAVERLGSGGYQVMLLDMKLPDGNGSQVYRVARQARPAPQVVVITGYRAEMEEKVRQVLSEGASGVMAKPFDVAALLATLRRLAGQGAEQS